jgi:phosphatidylinositol glycan class K
MTIGTVVLMGTTTLTTAIGAIGLDDDQGANENWALIVDASRYWFNYRHGANALSVYRSAKRMGIPDSRVVLMLADDHACDPRNVAHGRVYGDSHGRVELYGDDVEVDYRGTEVTPENFIRVLTNRHEPGTPRSKKLLPGPKSNVLVYITGHGGAGFIKFQDQVELRDGEISDAIAQMYARRRYNEILFLADTCQAATLAAEIRSPRVLSLSSSALGENSYSLFVDPKLGVHVIDRFTHHVLAFFEALAPESESTMGELVASLTRFKLMSTAVLNVNTFKHRDARSMKLSEFFGFVSKTRVLTGASDWFVGSNAPTPTPTPTNRIETPSVVAPVEKEVNIRELGFV